MYVCIYCSVLAKAATCWRDSPILAAKPPVETHPLVTSCKGKTWHTKRKPTSLTRMLPSQHIKEKRIIFSMCHSVISHPYITCVAIHNSTSFLQWWVKCPHYSEAALCHWRGLSLQLSSQPLEGGVASSWRSPSSCSGSRDRKLGNVCARGMNVMVRPLPARKRKYERSVKRFFMLNVIKLDFIKFEIHKKKTFLNMIKLLLSDRPWRYLFMQNKTTRTVFLKNTCRWFLHNNTPA